MAKFRKKPVVIDAIRWKGPFHDDGNVKDIRDFGATVENHELWGEMGPDCYTLLVWAEHEGCWVRCPTGHWIIKGVHGEFYPCSDEAFQSTYEPVEDLFDANERIANG